MKHFDQQHKWLRFNKITNYKIKNNGEVDVIGDVNLYNLNCYNGFPVKFGTIQGSFRAEKLGLRTLLNGPKIVTKNYYVGANNLKSLYGAPREVHGFFDCGYNPALTSLKWSPVLVGWDFHAHGILGLTDIVSHLFCNKRTIGGSFLLSGNVSGYYPESTVSNIINKHLPSKDILSCVDELLDAGLEEYCKLC